MRSVPPARTSAPGRAASAASASGREAATLTLMGASLYKTPTRQNAAGNGDLTEVRVVQEGGQGLTCRDVPLAACGLREGQWRLGSEGPGWSCWGGRGRARGHKLRY